MEKWKNYIQRTFIINYLSLLPPRRKKFAFLSFFSFSSSSFLSLLINNQFLIAFYQSIESIETLQTFYYID